MWVRAQVDYLKRLPNDLEKRIALKKLPPDLPQTYIRIFETMNSTYPLQTIRYIQRLLKWLVLGPSRVTPGPYHSHISHAGSDIEPPLDTLCRVICIENESDWPTLDIIPTTEQVLRWLGCLARFDQENKTIHLSHFTIKEFLSMDPQTISSPIARQFLVGLEDKGYLVNVCLTYLLHSHFEDTKSTTGNEVKAFLSQHPSYSYIAYTLCDHLYYYTGWNAEGDRLAKTFLSMPPSSAFKLWETCLRWQNYLDQNYLDKNYLDTGEYDKFYELTSHLPSPLHFATAVFLPSRVEGLLREGTDPDTKETLEGSPITPLHLAICAGTVQWFWITQPALVVQLQVKEGFPLHQNEGRQANALQVEEGFLLDQNEERQANALQMTGMLVKYGADVDRQLPLNLVVHEDEEEGGIREWVHLTVTPLVLALMCHNWRVASQLLSAGAASDATAHIDLESNTDVCSVKRFLDDYPEYEDIVQKAVDLGRHGELAETLKEWRSLRERGDSHSRSNSPSKDSNMNHQDNFMAAFSKKDWQEVRKLLSDNPCLDVDRVDEHGWNAVHYATACNEDALKLLLEHGAKPNPVSPSQLTPAQIASECGHVDNVKLLLEFGVDPNHRGPDGWTPLLSSVYGGQTAALQFLLDAGANINARFDNGSGALFLAMRSKNTTMVSTLLERKIDCLPPDNYGSSPLHFACVYQLEDQIERLIQIMDRPTEEVNANSLAFGTPLYAAAYAGSTSMINTLLHHGAEINQIRPGNLLGSALMAACSEGHNAAVKTLLSRGAALEVEGSRFKSAEGTARAFRKEEILRILEKHTKERGEQGKERNEQIHGNYTEHLGNMKDSK